jgi:hypothetical protein
VSPAQCGAFRLPPEGTPDRDLLDQFADFLAELGRRGSAAMMADPEWLPYVTGEGPPPAGRWHGPSPAEPGGDR